MKIAICQFDPVWEDKEANKKKILALLDACPDKGKADWIVFHEMTLTGFTVNVRAAELFPEDHAFFADLAKRHSLCVSYGGVHDGYNKLYTLDKTGRMAGEYAKIHLYSFGGEDKGFKAGDKQVTFPLLGLDVSPMVCFDLRFPYLFWRLAGKTDLYVVVAGWPMRRAEHWLTLLRARAVENQAYVVGVNRIGKDTAGVEYSGNSMLYDPMGNALLDCRGGEGVFVCGTDVAKAVVDKTRSKLPFFKDRREDQAFA